MFADFEIKRQKSVLKNGGTVINETRTFDSESGWGFLCALFDEYDIHVDMTSVYDSSICLTLDLLF